jgi:hypothetical protein
MNRTFISFLLIVTSMFCGCKKHQVPSVKIIENKEPKALLISKKQKIEVECLLPIMILTIGDKLVIYNEVEKDMFSVFGLDDYALLYQFGSSGKGPEDYQFIDRNTIREYKGNLTLLDRYRFKKIHLGAKNMNVVSSTLIPAKIVDLSGFTLVDDSLYIVDNRSIRTNDEIFSQSLLNHDRKVAISTYPYFNEKINNDQIERENISRKSMASRRSDGRICLLYTHMHRMKIFTKSGEMINDVSIGPLLTVVDNFDVESEKLFTGQVCVTDNYIYGLNINAKEDELFLGKNQTPLLEIWDWDGNLINVYALDEEILGFCVSEENKKIYATTLNYTNQILIYDLPKF